MMDTDQNEMSKCALDLCSSGCGSMPGSCELDNEPLGSIKERKFLD